MIRTSVSPIDANFAPSARRAFVAALATVALVVAIVTIPAAPASAAVVMSDANFRAELAAAPCDGSEWVIEIGSDFSMASSADPVWTCDDDLTIRSTAGNHFTVDGASLSNTRFLNASSSNGTITIENLTITDFKKTTTTSYSTLYGGAIRAGGPVVISGSTFRDNFLRTTGTGTPAQGGAIYSSDVVTVQASAASESFFIDNYATSSHSLGTYSAGGAIFANLGATISDATFTGNSALGSGGTTAATDGGAIFAPSYVTIADSTFTGNAAIGTFTTQGGAVLTNGIASIDNTTFADNEAVGRVDTNGGAVRSYTRVTALDSTFTGNTVTTTGTSPASGGAFAAPSGSAAGSTFTDNNAHTTNEGEARGGAVAVPNMSVNSSTFTGNSATSEDLGTTQGGALYSFGILYIEFSTFDDNASTTTELGALAIGGAVRTGFNAYIYASTFTGNSASATDPGDAFSGAVEAVELVSISNTFANNSSSTASQITTADLTSFGTVFASGVGSDNCVVFGTLTSWDFNFDDDGSCVPTGGTDFGDGVDPLLGALQNNGGPTKTMLPAAGSPLIDAITNGECVLGHADDAGFSDDTDQRGVDRPAVGCDVGAVEVLANVTFSIVTPGGTVNGTVYNALSVSDEAHVNPATLGTPPAGVAMPYGALDFTIQVPAPGWTVTVVLDLPAPVNQFWKFQSGTWAEVPGATIDGTTITYDLTDGGEGDEDGVANSEIVDPAAPANLIPTVVEDIHFVVPTAGGDVQVTVSNATCVEDVEGNPVSDYSLPPAGIALPYGVLEYSFCVENAGDTVDIMLTLPSPVTALYKVTSEGWSVVDSADISGAVITYSITDGGELDEDGVANSYIVDPVAPSVLASFTG